MTIYPARRDIDYSLFTGDDPESTRFGLPIQVAFCKRCVISNQRPNSTVEYQHTKDSVKRTIHLDVDGICDACKVAEQKHARIDWAMREEQLRELCARHRKTDGSYDCIVPGSGGKDSFFASHILREKYGMHPLTVTWAPHLYTEWGWKNFQSWIQAGFDNILSSPNGRVHRLLTRLALENIYHPFQPFFFGQKNIAPKMAAMYNTPLVFYGENEAEYGNPILSNDSARQDWTYFTASDKSKIFLGGTSLVDLHEKFGVDHADLVPYLPADPDLLERKKVEVHYLGYYLKWHPQSCYYYSVEHGGFQASPERTTGTYSKYSSIDDKIDDFHYYTTFIKFGIGRTTYDASQEIRSRDIERNEGLALVRRFDGEYPDRFSQEIFDYLSITDKDFPVASKRFGQPRMDRAYFDNLTDAFRSPHLWKHHEGVWKLRHTAWEAD